MKSIRFYVITLVTALLLSAVNIPAIAYGATSIDTEKDTSLVVDYHLNQKKIEGAQFELYRVADVSSSRELTLSGAFADYPVNIKDLDASGWKAAADTLAVYVKADKIPADQTMKTDAAGKIDFGVLRTGMYLLVCKEITIVRDTFRAAPALICLPNLTEDDMWEYNVTVSPKCTVTTTSNPTPGGDDGSTHVTVVKVWNDEGASALRPEGIEVSLLRDGEIYRTVDLNALNYWRYTWSGLETGHTWTVLEPKVPDGYTVTYTGEYTVRTITNSTTTPTEPGGGDTPTIIELTPENPPEILPKTGLLQWPIPILAIAGLLLFAFGWKDYMGKKDKDDEA